MFKSMFETLQDIVGFLVAVGIVVPPIILWLLWYHLVLGGTAWDKEELNERRAQRLEDISHDKPKLFSSF